MLLFKCSAGACMSLLLLSERIERDFYDISTLFRHATQVIHLDMIRLAFTRRIKALMVGVPFNCIVAMTTVQQS